MLRGKYTRYNQLYLYVFKGKVPQFHDLNDEDFIGYWEEEDLGVLFFHKPKDEFVRQLLAETGVKLETAACVPFEEWNEGRRLEPFRIGPFLLAPVWYEGEAHLFFDPGVVFGSGTHPTTRLCLEAFYRLWREIGPFRQVADLGCGSGLISLFAAKLKARVFAVDLNPLCIALTRKNINLNGLAAQVDVLQADVKALLPYKADLIVANLYKGLLLDLCALPSFWKGRYYLLSGFVPTMEEELRKVVKLYGEILFREERERWVLYGVKSRRASE